MAEEAKHGTEHGPAAEKGAEHGADQGHGDAHGHTEGHAEGPEDPMSHVTDVVWYGKDKTTGQWVKPYDSHGHLLKEYATYVPDSVGPFKLEVTKHMVGLTVAAAIFFVLSMTLAKAVLAGIKGNHAPRGKIANAMEAILVWMRDEMVIPVGGQHLAHYTPLFLNFFLLIAISNYLGMIPDFGSSTGNIGVSLALAGTVYALIWILGIANNGFGYITHLVPPGTPWWLYPVMFVLELTGPIIKCFVLAVRLFANMIAGHLVVSQLLGLGKIAGVLMIMGVPLAFGITLLEVLVCFLQAYVFTLLAVIFIGGAVHPEH